MVESSHASTSTANKRDGSPSVRRNRPWSRRPGFGPSRDRRDRSYHSSGVGLDPEFFARHSSSLSRFVAILTLFMVRFTKRSVERTDDALALSKQLDLLREQNAEQRHALELTRKQYERKEFEAHREDIHGRILVPLHLRLKKNDSCSQRSDRTFPSAQKNSALTQLNRSSCCGTDPKIPTGAPLSMLFEPFFIHNPESWFLYCLDRGLNRARSHMSRRGLHRQPVSRSFEGPI
jgi:hypothetical protein